jgi:hypothetical protein
MVNQKREPLDQITEEMRTAKASTNPNTGQKID